MDFRCVEVQDKHCTHVSERKFSPPSKCDLDGWKSRNFNPTRSTAQTIDFQKIRIQELLKPGDHEDGRVPHTVECELLEDLVDACIPGDVVTVTGIMRVINNYMYGSGEKRTVPIRPTNVTWVLCCDCHWQIERKESRNLLFAM